MSGSGQPGSPLDVPARLFVLRYQSGPPGAVAPPAVVVTVPEICAPHIDLIAATSGSDFVLDRPGACLVVRARKIATLNLTAQSPAGDGRLDAVLRLERLGHAYPTDNAVVEKDTSEDAPAFGVLAHLAHRGDVRVGAGRMGWWTRRAVPDRGSSDRIDRSDRMSAESGVSRGRMGRVGSSRWVCRNAPACLVCFRHQIAARTRRSGTVLTGRKRVVPDETGGSIDRPIFRGDQHQYARTAGRTFFKLD